MRERQHRERSPDGNGEPGGFAQWMEGFRVWLGHLADKGVALRGGFILADSVGQVIDYQAYDGFSFDKTEVEIWTRKICDRVQNNEEVGDISSFSCTVIPIQPDPRGVEGRLIVLETERTFGSNRLLMESLALSLAANILLAFRKQENRKLAITQNQLRKELRKRDYLFQITFKLNSQTHVDAILTEAIDSIRSFYPFLQIELYLSQENATNLPVKLLDFHHDDSDMCTRAYMEGRLLTSSDESCVPPGGALAVPLSGKQGVYGVLYLHSPEDTLDEGDIEFISLIAKMSGIAFENAKLYEHSNLLIGELRLINELTKRLNKSLELNEIYRYASSELINIFGADFCIILELDKNRGKMVVQASNLQALYRKEFDSDSDFSGIVYRTREPMIVSDYWSNPPAKSWLMEATGSRSLIASPILVSGEAAGVILVAHREPNFFSYGNYKLLQTLSDHIGLAMTNASLHAEVNRMAMTDRLTGLYARHYLDEQVNGRQKKDLCGSLIVVDIDHFKQINDTYGHQTGDKILTQVSSIIKSSIREGDIAARWGGEELAVYLPQVTIRQALKIAERIRERVWRETAPNVTVSCGVADWRRDDDKISVETLFGKADAALYEAKNKGRNQVKAGC